jgi:hypothetical protein
MKNENIKKQKMQARKIQKKIKNFRTLIDQSSNVQYLK